MNSSDLHLTIQNFKGLQSRYYHFMWGYFMPLIYWYHNEYDGDCNVHIKSCLTLDRHIKDLELRNVEIINNHDKIRNNYTKQITIQGYDFPANFANNAARILKVRDFLYERASIKTIDKHKHPRVLMIERREPTQLETLNKRRSIPNFNELVQNIQYLNPTVISLENASLHDQIKLFYEHDIIVAQHGAALSNIVFCRKHTQIIEITSFPHARMFSSISKSNVLDFRYERIEQEHDHSAIDVDQVTETIISKYNSF